MQQVIEIPSGLREGAVSGSQAVERALQLLSIVGRGAEKGVALADVVADSGLNKPTARRLLMALMRSRLVEQDELTRRYYLGGELYVLGMLASRRHGLLEMAGESLKRLSGKSADTSFVSMRRDDYAVCLHREEGTHPVRTHALLTGDQNPLGVGAGSLAMLAALPDAEVEAVLGRIEGVIAAQYPGYSPQIIREDVARSRELGYALNPGRVIANSWGIGMAILLPDGRLAGALSIAAIDSRMGEARQKELVGLLAHEVERVQGKLKLLFSSEKPALRKAPQAARSRTPERV
ncbi:IclR-family regulatory protein [Neorhizobium galegae bv. officinalis bv. officinalis str. HAMBI 1141]|uniref:IclR-family regulatory protein n=1 Tax=Neorhizobium galegae bv. officinalis bv. officinalis str. HAMBI 1141 TaxID=1028801 RepID=A0A068TDG3_NEOGA|nr:MULTISPECIES: IclR family transcriptional regulator [Neorhizobium]MCJ9753510.1 IclR family transcriptional regulator [Neorhizobium sp. BETTINA12A]CDN56096.1 IclR-family regulatory protein [Neorhizobium galegae bv. officinalis bv. officinalis str. HAMBI 1141]